MLWLTVYTAEQDWSMPQILFRCFYMVVHRSGSCIRPSLSLSSLHLDVKKFIKAEHVLAQSYFSNMLSVQEPGRVSFVPKCWTNAFRWSCWNRVPEELKWLKPSSLVWVLTIWSILLFFYCSPVFCNSFSSVSEALWIAFNNGHCLCCGGMSWKSLKMNG